MNALPRRSPDQQDRKLFTTFSSQQTNLINRKRDRASKVDKEVFDSSNDLKEYQNYPGRF